MSEYASGDDGDDSIDDEEGVVEEMINDWKPTFFGFVTLSVNPYEIRM